MVCLGKCLPHLCALRSSASSVQLTFLLVSIIITLLPASGQNPIYMFGTAAITEWVNLGFLWLYVGCLLLSFVLVSGSCNNYSTSDFCLQALGNRPKSESSMYTFLILANAVFSYYLLAAAALLTFRAFKVCHYHLSMCKSNAAFLGCEAEHARPCSRSSSKASARHSM